MNRAFSSCSAGHVAMPWARSVIICALNYNASRPALDRQCPARNWVDRPIRMECGALREHGEQRGRGTGTNSSPPDLHHYATSASWPPAPNRVRIASKASSRDTMLRRHRPLWSSAPSPPGPALAGIGKNTCVINQELRSWLLLGVIVPRRCRSHAALELPIAADRIA